MNVKWKNGAQAPENRYGHAALCLNGMIYVGGGMNKIESSYTIDCFDVINDSWIPSIDTPYCFFSMTVLNNKLILVGGYNKNTQATKEILAMDAGQLKLFTTMITARACATAAGHQEMLIISGGIDKNLNKLTTTVLFDSKNQQWYNCNDLPEPYCSLKSVIVDDMLYMLGGINKDGSYSSAVFAAPLNTLLEHQLKWYTLQDTPWWCCTPVSVNNTHLLIVGGNKDTYTSDVYKFNKIIQHWESIGHVPIPLHSSAVVSTANKVTVIGGRISNRNITNAVWIGTFEPQE